MKTINFPLIWDYVKSYIIPVILIILVINQCSNRASPQVAVNKANYERLKENNVILQERVKSVLYQSKITNKEVEVKDSLIALRELERDNLKQQLDVIRSNAIKKRTKIMKLDKKGFADNINERFNTKDAVVTDKGIELQKDLPIKVVSSLVYGEVVNAELNITRKMLESEFEKSNLLTGQVTMLKADNERLTFGLNETLSNNIELTSLAESQNKSITKLERKRKLNKFLVPIGIGLGFIAGFLIAN